MRKNLKLIPLLGSSKAHHAKIHDGYGEGYLSDPPTPGLGGSSCGRQRFSLCIPESARRNVMHGFCPQGKVWAALRFKAWLGRSHLTQYTAILSTFKRGSQLCHAARPSYFQPLKLHKLITTLAEIERESLTRLLLS